MYYRDRLRGTIVELAQDFLDPESANEHLSVFLCGGAERDQDILRKGIGERIEQLKKSRYRYSVHYPEEMFEELVLGTVSHNYLTLENMLANSANSIVILLDSPGTLVELGAFANRSELRDKLVVLVRKRYKGKKSFLSMGPLRDLEKNSSSHVIYVNYDELLDSSSIYKISELCREVNRTAKPDVSLANPIRAREMILAVIRTFEPLPREAVVVLARLFDNRDDVDVSVQTIVNMLLRVGAVRLLNGSLVVTAQGKNSLMEPLKGKMLATNRRERLLVRSRCEALDLTARKRRSYDFWRGVISV